MKIISDKKLKEIKICKPLTFKDFRGEIWTKWDKKNFKNKNFNLCKFTKSKKNVLRGFHGDTKSWKLVSCIKGDPVEANVFKDFNLYFFLILIFFCFKKSKYLAPVPKKVIFSFSIILNK